MEPIFCIVVGLFFAASIYLMLSPQFIRILLGVSIFGNAVNLLIFTAGRLREAAPPVIAPTSQEAAVAAPIAPVGAAEAPLATPVEAFAATANPLPQALILTAIVIAFSIFAFLLVLALRAYQLLRTDEIDEMRLAEPVDAARPPLGY